MNEWLVSWHNLYEEIETKWIQMTASEQQKDLAYLEEFAGELIDQWTELDECLNKLRTEKEQLGSIADYKSAGTTYYELEMFAKAATLLESEQATGIQDELRRLYLGYSYLFNDQMLKSKETFLYLIHTNRNQYIKHFSFVGLGCVQTKLERIEDAIIAFEKANQLTSTDDVVYNLGICYYTVESFHIAKQYFLDYLKRVPDDGEALFYYGCCLWQEGERESALSSWLTSVHLLDSPAVMLAFAYVCEWHGHHRTAIHCYKQLQLKKFDQVKVLHGLAWNYALSDDKTNAQITFRKAIELDPLNLSVNQSLAWLEERWPDTQWQ